MFGLTANVFTNKLPNYKFEFSEFKLLASEQVRRLKDEWSVGESDGEWAKRTGFDRLTSSVLPINVGVAFKPLIHVFDFFFDKQTQLNIYYQITDPRANLIAGIK